MEPVIYLYLKIIDRSSFVASVMQNSIYSSYIWLLLLKSRVMSALSVYVSILIMFLSGLCVCSLNHVQFIVWLFVLTGPTL